MTEDAYTGTGNLEAMAEAVRYNAFLENLVRSHAPLSGGRGIAVDFGAGIGTFSGVLGDAPARLICVETDPDQAQRLRDRGFETATLPDIADASVDFVFSLNVLEHIADDRAILAELFRILKPGGRLFLYLPAFTVLWSAMDDLVRHYRRYTRGMLMERLQGAGFAVRRTAYADSAGFFATLAFKMLRRGQAADGRLARGPLILFDRYAFPVGRLLDRLGMQYLLGKNVWAVAERPPQA
ncbi:MAG: methyltransferase domain-containing protein [Rhodospirillaceae bacterium]